MKNISKLPLMMALFAALWVTGCRQTSQQRRSEAAPKAEPAIASCDEPTRGPVKLAKQLPKEVTLGETFEYRLTVDSRECVGNVVVTDHVPAGATFVRSEPAAEVSGDVLTWRLNDMDAGQNGVIRVWLKAEKEGTLASCATISANPRVCAATIVGKPTLTITKSGPETAVLGSTITYNVVVANTGSAVARDVVMTDPVPEGFGGSPVTVNVGDLAPSQSKTIQVSFTANQRGRFCNVATAKSSNAGEVKAEACTVVQQPGVKITKEGTKEQYLTRNATYEIVISNTGDTALTGVVVTDATPAQTTIVDAGGGTVDGHNITWTVGDLAVGASKSFKVVATSTVAGNLCDTASVMASQGLKESAEACTLWKGVSGLLLEEGDSTDPIQVGEQTTYYVRVVNQGTAPDADIKIVVKFPKEITPVSADNGGQVDGQTVTFPTYPNLAAKQSFEYHIVAKGAAAGDARVVIIRTSRDIPNPTTGEESTRVY